MPKVDTMSVRPAVQACASNAERSSRDRAMSFTSEVEARRQAAADRIQVDTEWGDRESFLGSAIDLHDAGILGAHHLAEMERRGTRRLTFAPNGDPVSFRTEVPWGTGGYLRVNILHDRAVYVERSLPGDGQRDGLVGALRACAGSMRTVVWSGTRAHLMAIGFPADVFDGVLRPGRAWGQRRTMMAGVPIDVSAVFGVVTQYRIASVPAVHGGVPASTAPATKAVPPKVVALKRPAAPLRLVSSR